MIWHLDPRFPSEAGWAMVGLIPRFLSADDPRPAREQFQENYAHGGGWIPVNGFLMRTDGDLQFPDDRNIVRTVAKAQLRKEVIRVHQHSWVSIAQPDGTFEVARMD